jgi:hypothetical protein
MRLSVTLPISFARLPILRLFIHADQALNVISASPRPEFHVLPGGALPSNRGPLWI